REMNRQFLGVDEPTDVLSFPDEADDFVQGMASEPLLGDIAIALPTASRQAESIGHPLDAEVAHLPVHGIPQLCGYDHVTGLHALAPLPPDPDGALRLRMDDRHHSFAIHESDADTIAYAGWETDDAGSMADLAARLDAAGMPVREATSDELEARRVAGMIAFD